VYSFEVECFNGLGAAEGYDVEYCSQWPSKRLGREVVAIAGNGAGDQLIFLAHHNPAVYQWIHDQAVPPVRMASSFSELLRLVSPGVLDGSLVIPIEEADSRIVALIAALNSFEPSRDDIDKLYDLYRLFEGFHSLPDRDRVAPALFGLVERFPDRESGSSGPLDHHVGALLRWLEAIPSHLPLLRESLHRWPVQHTVWMVIRQLNTTLPRDQTESWLSELRAAAEHPLASAQTRRFAEDSLANRRKRKG
jgi:hypothetical protein